MEASFVSAEQRTSKAKTVALVALAVVGTFAACFLLFNQAASTSFDDRTAAYDSYSHWKTKYNLTYGGAEDKLRFANYYANYEIVKAHYYTNSTYSLGMTPFAAMDLSEFVATHLGVIPKPAGLIGQVRLPVLDETDLATTVDWTTKGAVTPVKNQGQCGSCWSFSTTGSLEGLNFIKTGKLLSFSEQDLVDCSQSFGNQGCNGGLMDYAFQYVEKNGIALESDYPYTGTDGTCNNKVKRVKVNTGYSDVVADSVGQLKAAIAKGPVSVAIEADTSAFQLYTGGVISGSACGTQLDHGVLAVGYNAAGDDSNGVGYYKVKNSWGASWGVAGYVNIAIANGDGTCGIQKSASYPTEQ